jgi:hypothetical protein
VKSSDVFSNKDYSARQMYCTYLNNEMSLTPPFCLYPTNINPDSSKRELFKLMANSFLVSFSRNVKSIIVQNQTQLEEAYFSHNQHIEDIFCLSDQICQIQQRC